MLFTGTTNSLYLTTRISIPTRPISINLHILCPPYMQPYIPNLKEIRLVVCEMSSRKLPHFLSSPLHRFTKVILSQPKKPSHVLIPFKFGTPIWHFVAYGSLNFGDV